MLLVNLSQNAHPEYRYLSRTLIEHIDTCLKQGQKTILYINKRGSHSSLVCTDCNHLFGCPACDHALSIHTHPPKLLCHICGHHENIPLTCSACHGTNLLQVGVGTQQLEQQISFLFPQAQVFRFDFDQMKQKKQKSEAIAHLHSADIIIGTKMITTGFDFKKVGLIGVILLEQELQIPVYNTEEKVYQNIKQLLGRGDRPDTETEVIIQTYIPENPIIDHICNANYKSFFQYTLKERKEFYYPPFCEIAWVEYRHLNEERARDFIARIYEKLQHEDTEKAYRIDRSLSPIKRYHQYHFHIMIRGENIRQFLGSIKDEILRNKGLIVKFGE